MHARTDRGLRIIRRLANGDIASLPNLAYKIGRDCDELPMWEAYRLAGFDVAGLSLTSSPRERWIAFTCSSLRT